MRDGDLYSRFAPYESAMKDNFKIIILIVFIAAAIVGVLVFSGAIPLGGGRDKTGSGGTVVLWGTVETQIVNSLLENFNRVNPAFVVRYVEKSEETFGDDLLESFIAGTGPDMFIISDDLVFKYSNKIFTLPYQGMPLSTFKNNFVGAGEIFTTAKGLLAFPLSVDPLVMYYNQSMLDGSGVAFPPAYWDDFSALIPLLTKKDEAGRIVKSTVALGQFTNILHAKDILATLFMQAGSPIVREENDSFVSALGRGSAQRDLSSILRFYTDFADPLRNVYSWNKSLDSSLDAFSREDLAFYFGFASELSSLIKKNPNQNFGVAPMPQIRDSSFKLTFAKVTGVAVSSFSKNLDTAFEVANLLSQSDFASGFAASLGVAPARRDLIKAAPSDAYLPIFYTSALYGRSWPDPSPKDTDDIFRGMVEKVLSNSMTAEQAVNDAGSKLRFLLLK